MTVQLGSCSIPSLGIRSNQKADSVTAPTRVAFNAVDSATQVLEKAFYDAADRGGFRSQIQNVEVVTDGAQLLYRVTIAGAVLAIPTAALAGYVTGKVNRQLHLEELYGMAINQGGLSNTAVSGIGQINSAIARAYSLDLRKFGSQLQAFAGAVQANVDSINGLSRAVDQTGANLRQAAQDFRNNTQPVETSIPGYSTGRATNDITRFYNDVLISVLNSAGQKLQGDFIWDRQIKPTGFRFNTYDDYNPQNKHQYFISLHKLRSKQWPTSPEQLTELIIPGTEVKPAESFSAGSRRVGDNRFENTGSQPNRGTTDLSRQTLPGATQPPVETSTDETTQPIQSALETIDPATVEVSHSNVSATKKPYFDRNKKIIYVPSNTNVSSYAFIQAVEETDNPFELPQYPTYKQLNNVKLMGKLYIPFQLVEKTTRLKPGEKVNLQNGESLTVSSSGTGLFNPITGDVYVDNYEVETSTRREVAEEMLRENLTGFSLTGQKKDSVLINNMYFTQFLSKVNAPSVLPEGGEFSETNPVKARLTTLNSQLADLNHDLTILEAGVTEAVRVGEKNEISAAKRKVTKQKQTIVAKEQEIKQARTAALFEERKIQDANNQNRVEQSNTSGSRNPNNPDAPRNRIKPIK